MESKWITYDGLVVADYFIAFSAMHGLVGGKVNSIGNKANSTIYPRSHDATTMPACCGTIVPKSGIWWLCSCGFIGTYKAL